MMRYRKRQDMRPGEWDNITERMPQMSMRLAPWVIEELVAWLQLHARKYAQQAEGLRAALANGSHCQGQLDYANAACRTVLDICSRVRDRWSVADWHTACEMAADSLGTIFTGLPPITFDLDISDDGKGESGADPADHPT